MKARLIILLLIFLGTSILAPKAARYFERQSIAQKNEKTIEIIEKKIAGSAYLENVPFITQAPLETEDNWTLHEESCEEAAVLQAYLYETGQTMTKDEANEKILDMITWQTTNFGGHFDLYAPEMEEFMTKYFGIQRNEVRVIFDAEIDDIKKEISAGHPVIVPITGEILKNPYYPYPGYHMLTVIGYTEDRIITNDNGTRRGKDFSYDIATFEKAMKDAGGDILVFDLIATADSAAP